MRRYSPRKSFALLDYMCGTVVLVSALATVTSLNMTKFRILKAARHRQMAIYSRHNLLELESLRYSRAKNFETIRKQFNKQNAWVELSIEGSSEQMKQLGTRAKAKLRARALSNRSDLIELNIEIRWFHTKESSTSLNFSRLIRKQRN